MAKQTDIKLRSAIFYQAFPRQHSNTQDFNGVTKDLDRIQSLGVDILYLLPIHPIGERARKGTKGSPYSIIDYYAIHPDLGSLDDFKKLVNEAKKRNIRVMIDIVFNHTSRDSKLVDEHPDWFYRKQTGELANRVGDWSDIADLDFRNRGVWDYLIEVLEYWAAIVDGFRCDVAPLLPIEFWQEARTAVEKINPKLIWLTESVHPGFVKYIRDIGYDAQSDAVMYQAFDICYDYDIFDYMDDYLKDPKKLSRWLEEIFRQECVYPNNYVKLRSFENHDQQRLRSKTRDQSQFIQMNAMMYFLRGSAFIYSGQEHSVNHFPDLFEDDLIPWHQGENLESFFTTLAKIKKNPLFIDGIFEIHEKEKAAVLSYHNQDAFLLGIFNLENEKILKVPLKDGTYQNLINQQKIVVRNGQIDAPDFPIMIETKKDINR